MRNRLVIKYLEIDENNNVVNEWQERILDAQEPHHRHHHSHHTPPPTPVEVIPKVLVVDLQIDDTKDYTAYDRMARITYTIDGGFDGNEFIVGDGGWYTSGERSFTLNLPLGQDYYIRLATPNNPLQLMNNQGSFTQVVSLFENGVETTQNWLVNAVGNNQLQCFTKKFTFNGSYPKITFKIDLI